MSAKWRALQHRHRYTYSAVVFPQYYTSSLAELPHDALSYKFFSDLKELVSLTSTYTQLSHVKSIASSFGEVLAHGDQSLISLAASLYLEIMFLENSVPLHKTLASALAKARSCKDLISSCFRLLCEKYCSLKGNKGEGKRFCVSRAALSMMGTPKLGYLTDVVEQCSVLVALDIVNGLNLVVKETHGWARPSPLLMEQCQEALSCLYYLMQRYPSSFVNLNESHNSLVGESSCILEITVSAILGILGSSAFSRDCYVAAGVSFCSALQVCLTPEEIGYLIIECVFGVTEGNLIGDCKTKFDSGVAKVPFKGDLCAEIRKFSSLSRLCLIRGILTAIPREVLNTQFTIVRDRLSSTHSNGTNGKLMQILTILYDGILPNLCHYCENPTDSHFNFHALTVMQICLQQIKTSLLADLTVQAANFDPMPEEMRNQIVKIVWNNLEDPLSQSVKQVHLILDLLLDIYSTLHQGNHSEKVKPFLSKIADDLLCLGPRCKGRYVPLASLIRRLGAKTLLGMNPRLLFETIEAYADDDVCCAATSFLKCFLESLRDEYWSSDGIGRGYEIYRCNCLPPVLRGLASGISKLRSNLNTYALPCLLEVDVDSIFPLLSFLSVAVGDQTDLVFPELSGLDLNLDIEQRVAAFVSLIRVSRFLALFEGDIELCHSRLMHAEEVVLENKTAILFIKGIQVKVPVEWLVLALTHVDPLLRVDAAESLFLNPKTASLPSHLELDLMRQSVPLNMRCSSTAFLMKWTSLLKKFFSRVKTALERQIKQGVWYPNVAVEGSRGPMSRGSVDEKVVNRAADLFNFMRWLSRFLFLSCYPSAPYERKTMAMELILIMIKIWSIVAPPLEKRALPSSEVQLYPYDHELTLPDSTILLVGSMVDSWDRLRENSFHILLRFPAPLPGIASNEMMCQVISWAKRLACSPRVRESDAGALTLRLIFRKYVIGLGWTVRASSSIVCIKSASELCNGDCLPSISKFPVVEYIKSLIDWLCSAIEEGERDLLQACQHSFVHGILLALRYSFEELDWNADIVIASVPEMRNELAKLLQLVMRITSLALWVVSADAWYLPDDMDDAGGLEMELQTEIDASSSVYEKEVNDSQPSQDKRPSEQIVMVGCWLAMKEVSLLLGTIIRKIPLPSSASPDQYHTSGSELNSSTLASAAVLDLKQMEGIGDHFLKVLLKMKHNGAIDKTRAGFTALCNRLLCSNDPRLCHLTEYWMEQLMERLIVRGQTVDDLLRRSAGIPAAFSAFFLSEPEGAPKKLLPRALKWLIDVASGSLFEQSESCTLVESSSNLSCQKHRSDSGLDTNEDEKASKMRIEGIIPIVHAFNVIKAAFNDATLATDTSGFAAEAMIVAISSFSSSHWEVRNSACLAYTALVRRMVGFLNVHKRESARRAITGVEFFHRYPALHPFIFNELKIATELLVVERSQSNLAQVVHPSLCPMLILLSRLKPSPIASETGDELDPFQFMPFIQRCSIQSNVRVRVLASRALTGLVSNEKLHSVVIRIASDLPFLKDPTTNSSSTSTGKSGHASLNSIHGILLQLEALVSTNCGNLVEVSTKDMILDHLFEVLVKSSWIGKPRCCPCPTLNGTFLRVLDTMLSISRASQSKKSCGIISSLLFDLSSECLSVAVSDRSSFYDPTVEELRKQAAMSYFGCIFQKSGVSAQKHPLNLSGVSSAVKNATRGESEIENGFVRVDERLIFFISDKSYEVRLATLKWLLQFVQDTEIGSTLDSGLYRKEIETIHLWVKANLQTELTKLLSLETHHKCAYHILRILFAWNLLHFQKPVVHTSRFPHVDSVYIGEMDYESVLELWNKLTSMYDVSRHTKTKRSLVGCMGFCVRRFTVLFRNAVLPNGNRWVLANRWQDGELERCSILYTCINRFVRLAKHQSAASEPVNMRKAAAESMIASGLLEQTEFIGSFISSGRNNFQDCSFLHFEPREAINMFAYQILEVWFTCVRLLEDEDEFLREALALDVQRCFPDGFINSFQTGFVPAQVEKVIELSFKFLSLVFGHWNVYFDYLSRWALAAASNVVCEGDLVRKVFDKEIDNHHEEKLLICQICFSHLEKLPGGKGWGGDDDVKWHESRELFKAWRAKFWVQLVAFADYHKRSNQEGVNWIGGVGNHKDAFLPLYANLLGIYVFSKRLIALDAREAECMFPEVVELGKSISPFLGNPLISNMYILLLKLHEIVGSSDSGIHLAQLKGDGEHLWAGFEPYFLLR